MSDRHVVFLHAALDETPQGEVVLRGVVDPASLDSLQVGDYQREVLPLASINQLVKALELGTVPDIELAMRGEEFTETTNASGERTVVLQDPVYIVDGLQRVSAAKLKMSREGGVLPHLGAVVHFATTEEWERERFRILNMERTKLSPNVLLRNWRYDNTVLETLYQLTQHESGRAFVMRGRVCWAQRMRRDELITAAMLLKVVGRIHAHMGPSTTSVQIRQLTSGLQRVHDLIGRNVFRDNVKTFFDVIDQAYGVRRVQFKEGAIYMRGTFLYAVARLFSNHEDFWRDNRLVVEAPLLRKLATFPFRDPQVVGLSASAGKASEMLYMLMVNHINSGKRTKRLRPRIVDYPRLPIDEVGITESDLEEEASAASEAGG